MRKLILLVISVCLVVSLFSLPSQTGRAQTPKVTARLLHTITSGDAYFWSPDSQTLAVYHEDVDLYDTATGQIRARIKYSWPPPLNGLYFTPDSNTLVMHGIDRVRLYSAADGKLLREFAKGSMPINYYEKFYKEGFMPGSTDDGRNDNTYVVPSNLEQTRELPTEYIGNRVVSPDGQSLLARIKGGAGVYDMSTGELRFELEAYVAPGKKKPQKAVALGEFSPNGKFIVTSYADRTPRLWQADTGKLIANLAPQSDIVYGVRFSSDSRFVATTSFYDGVVKIWDTATGELRQTVGSKKDSQWFAVWNPRNNTFVTKSPRTDKWEINIWNAETGALVSKLDGKALKEKFDENLTFVYSPDGRILATKAKNNINLLSVLSPKNKLRLIAHLWDAETGALITSLSDTDERGGDAYDYDKFFWNPAGDLLITAGVTVKLWTRRGELLQELATNAVARASLSPDGKLLAVTGELPENLRTLAGSAVGILTGKLPKVYSSKTYVWKLEG